MRIPVLAAALIASSAALVAQPASAAPLSSMLVLQNADSMQVETVQWRRGGSRAGRWIGPAVGVATGLAIVGALASRPYYGGDGYGYGYAPAYGYAPSYGYAPVEPYYGDYGYGGWAGSGRPGCNVESRDTNPMCQ